MSVLVPIHVNTCGWNALKHAFVPLKHGISQALFSVSFLVLKSPFLRYQLDFDLVSLTLFPYQTGKFQLLPIFNGKFYILKFYF